MVNMIGFHTKSPFERIVVANNPGEPGWYMNVRPRPTIEHPLRASVAYPTGRATFDSPDDARLYLDHPGHVPLAAQIYLAHWGEEGTKE